MVFAEYDRNMVIFVGDKPSSKNTDQNVPFIGTKSCIRLNQWVKELTNSDYYIVNSNTQSDITLIQIWSHWPNVKFVSLGNNAEKVLKRLDIESFKLPHPSPRNRKLNDKFYEKKILKECKQWLLS
jgi:uracil-DNA glycosylase